MCFTIFLNEKSPLQATKTRSWNSPKTESFPKGLTQAFGQKNGYFSIFFFFGNIEQENVFYDILERKIAFASYKNKKLKQSKNWEFSKGVNPGFWSKKWLFFHLFFFGNIEQENVFYDILKRKNAFLSYKNKKLKQSRNWDFSKGVNLWFWSKNGHFSNFFF